MTKIQIKELEAAILYDLSKQESQALVGGAVVFVSRISGIPEPLVRLAAIKAASGFVSELEKIVPLGEIPSSGNSEIDDAIRKLYQGQNLPETLFNAGLK